MASTKYRFQVPAAHIGGVSDVAYVSEGEDPLEEIRRTIWQDLATDLEVRISGVTMFAAAWDDPDHWSSDWAEQLGIPVDEVPEAVAALVEGSVES